MCLLATKFNQHHATALLSILKLSYRTLVMNITLQAQWKNSVDPDHLASQKKQADQDLHCFKNRILTGEAR